MNRWRHLADRPGVVAIVAVVGMVATFAAGWGLGGSGAVDVEPAPAAAARTLPAEGATPQSTASPGTSTASTDLPTAVSVAPPGPAGPAETGQLPSPTKADRVPIREFTCPRTTVAVSTAAELTAALAAASPGAVITLAPGVYQGRFVVTRKGSPRKPIYLCGSREAVLDSGRVDKGYALHLNGSSWWRVKGFTVRNAQKGVMLDGVTGVALDSLLVEQIGDEAVHLRRHSSRNVVRGIAVGQTGLRRAKFGEGVYIGTARSNWCRITRCQPDRSDGNFVIDNVFAGTSAEAVDIKEGTTGGVVAGNRFDGSSITAADSWVDVKGNGWLIHGNRGVRAPEDGYQVHEIVSGAGFRNLFSANVSTVDAGGYAIKVTKRRSGNMVTCDNVATGAGSGLTNIDCD